MTSDARTPNRIRQLGGQRKYDNLGSEESGPLITRQLEQITEKINDMVLVRKLPFPRNLAAVGFSGGCQLRWDDLSDDMKPSLAGARVWRANSLLDSNTEFNLNSNKRQIADLVKTTFYVDLTAEEEINYIYWVQNVNHDGIVSQPAGGKIATKTVYKNCPLTLSDSISIVADGNQGYYFRILFDHAITSRTLSITNAKCGQKFIFELIQSSVGNDIMSVASNFAFGADIPALTLSTVANDRDFLGVVYEELTDKFYVVAWVRAYESKTGGGGGGYNPPVPQTDIIDLVDDLAAKAFKTTSIICSAPLSGGGDLSQNRTISITKSSAGADGYLSSTDWSTFNNKSDVTLPIAESDVTGLVADLSYLAAVIGTLSSTVNSLALQVATNSNSISILDLQVGTNSASITSLSLQIGSISTQIGTFSATLNDLALGTLTSSVNAKAFATTSITCIAPLSGGGDLSQNRTISLTFATSAQDGYLKSADWTTFDGKAPTNNATFTGTTSFPVSSYINDLGVGRLAGLGVGGARDPVSKLYVYSSALATYYPLYALANNTLQANDGGGWYGGRIEHIVSLNGYNQTGEVGGVQCVVNLKGAGKATQAAGLICYMLIGGGQASNADLAVALDCVIGHYGSGTISNAYAIRAFCTAGGNITNFVGFYVDDPIAVGAAAFRGDVSSGTGKFNLYMAGSAINYLAGALGIGTTSPKSNLHVVGLPAYANNAAAVAGGLTAGAFYRTGGDPDLVCVVH